MGQPKYFLYARKSTEGEDRQILSIDSQIGELKRIALNQGLEIIEVLTESMSAKEPGRPIFNKMMDRICAGESHGILCWKLDRLARNPIDGGMISWILQKGILQHIRTYEQNYFPSDNVIMMNVEFGMANQYVRDLSVGVKRGLRKKIEMGWLPGVAPEGYLNTPDREKGYKVIIEDPQRFPLVQRAWKLMLTGDYTVPEVLNIMNTEWGYTTVRRRREGGDVLSRSALYRMLTNPFYAGIIIFKGEEQKQRGAHTAMITLGEFERVQTILGRNGKPRRKKHTFPYSGLMRCQECRRVLSADQKIKKQKNGNVHTYVYYSCKKMTCSQKGISTHELEKQITQLLSNVESSNGFINHIAEMIRDKNSTEGRNHGTAGYSNIECEYNACLKRIDGLIDMRAAKELTQEEFLQKKEKELSEKLQLQKLLEDSEGNGGCRIAEIDEAIRFTENAKKIFEKGSAEEKRETLIAISSNLSVKDKILYIENKKSVFVSTGIENKAHEILSNFEPAKTFLLKEKTGL